MYDKYMRVSSNIKIRCKLSTNVLVLTNHPVHFDKNFDLNRRHRVIKYLSIPTRGSLLYAQNVWKVSSTIVIPMGIPTTTTTSIRRFQIASSIVPFIVLDMFVWE